MNRFQEIYQQKLTTAEGVAQHVKSGFICACPTALGEPSSIIAAVGERAKKGDTAWEYYDSWEKENLNADRAASNRALDVEGGYYYRVRCFHAANEDISSSFTNGVYVEEP